MRYKINYNKTINQLLPHYLQGRKLILYLQALMSPLQQLNDSFVIWAKETKIEAAMTSQVFKLEWFLNRKFNSVFANNTQSIVIRNSYANGLPVYYESENMGGYNMSLHNESEGVNNTSLYYMHEDTANVAYSFVVFVPLPDETKISASVYESQVKYWLDKYKLANKNYKIIYV